MSHDPVLPADAAPEPAGFRWPTPPLASYPPARAQIDHEPCEIVGLNGRVMQGRLNLFVPEDQVAHIQVPPARTTMPLRFGQFRSLSLKRPLLPLADFSDEVSPPPAAARSGCSPSFPAKPARGRAGTR